MSTYPSTASLPQSANVVLRYLLDEASGNAIDEVGSNDLTDTNTVGATTGYSDLGASFDNSRDFEFSTDEFFTKADFAAADITGALTIAIFINPESDSAGPILGKLASDGSQFAYLVQRRPGGAIRMSVTSDGSTEVPTTTVETPSTATWTHIVAVYRPSTNVEIYINGSSVITNSTSIPASIHNSTAPLNIGSYGDNTSETWDGFLQDAIVWNVALSDAEVTSLYALYTTSPTTTSTTTTTSSSTTTTSSSTTTTTTSTSSSTSSTTTTTSSSTTTTTTTSTSSSTTTTSTSTSITDTTTSSTTTTTTTSTTTTSSSTSTTTTSSSTSSTTTTTSSSTSTTTTSSSTSSSTSTTTTTTLPTIDRPTFSVRLPAPSFGVQL